jgi:hypothetical protein
VEKRRREGEGEGQKETGYQQFARRFALLGGQLADLFSLALLRPRGIKIQNAIR